ncbi:MAG: T9SS type A sorting domain-containing protein [Bacteroidia bacterium]
MKHIIFIAFCLFSCISSIAQQLDRSVFSSNGSSIIAGNIWLDYTIGEMAVQNFTTDILNLNEGFNQVFGKNIILTHPTNINIFPNPTTGYLQIDIPDEMVGFLFYNFTEITGKVILINESESTRISVNNTVLNVSSYRSGLYILGILDTRNNSITNFKIIIL